ncbi:MAG: DUF4350 domain-containing protein [Bernardetiaceae bacterium]
MKKYFPAAVILIALATFGFWLYQQWHHEHLNDWRDTFAPTDKIPFGTYVLSQLLQKEFPGERFTSSRRRIYKSLPTQVQGQLYVYVGDRYFLTTADRDSLLAFVSNGNTAFIASPDIFRLLKDTLEIKENLLYHFDSLVRVSVGRKSYNFPMIDYFDTVSHHWRYLENAAPGKAIGFLNEYPNFVRYAFGDGFFYLHAEAFLFTNYFILQEQGYQYARRVFAALPPTDRVHWDNAARIPIRNPESDIQTPKESPLRFILSQSSLRWAYYVLLTLIFLLLIFKSKRIQRTIPVLQKPENTSLLFIETLSSLYRHDFYALAILERDLFFAFVRDHFHYAPTQSAEDLHKILQQRSSFDEDKLQTIFHYLKEMDSYPEKIDAHFLNQFHGLLEDFYAAIKISPSSS